MASQDKKRRSEEDFATNPSVNPDTGEVNPSAPTAGTEGWGTIPDERRALNPNSAGATREGQMKGDLGDDQVKSQKQS